MGPRERRHWKHLISSGVNALHRIANTLQRIEARAYPRKRAGTFAFAVEYSNKREEVMPLEIPLTTEQRVKVTANPMTPAGKPAQVDGAVEFTTESQGVTIEPDPDGRSAFINSPDAPGDIVVLVSADADLGQGVTTIQDTVLVHVSDPQAASLGLSASPPEPKP